MNKLFYPRLLISFFALTCIVSCGTGLDDKNKTILSTLVVTEPIGDTDGDPWEIASPGPDIRNTRYCKVDANKNIIPSDFKRTVKDAISIKDPA